MAASELKVLGEWLGGMPDRDDDDPRGFDLVDNSIVLAVDAFSKRFTLKLWNNSAAPGKLSQRINNPMHPSSPGSSSCGIVGADIFSILAQLGSSALSPENL